MVAWRVACRGKRFRLLAGALALGMVTALLVAGSPTVAKAATASCPDVLFLGSRGSGQPGPGPDQTGLGSPLDALNTRLDSLVKASGLTYDYFANPYPAVPVTGWPGIINGIAAKTTGYIKDIGMYRWSVSRGEELLKGQITEEINNCDSSKLVLAGFSQGAQVTGNVYQGLSSAQLSHIFAVELFGDPRFNGKDPVGMGDYDPMRNGTLTTGPANSPRPLFPSSGVVQSWCHYQDIICQGFWKYGPKRLPLPSFDTTNHSNYDQEGDINGPADSSSNPIYPQRAADWIADAVAATTPTNPPVAVLTQPGTLPSGEPVTLSAGQSWDPSGSPLTYSWDFDGSRSYGTSTGTTPRVTHTFPAVGTYLVDLKVTNSAGLSATATVTVAVADPGNEASPPGAPENVVSTPSADFTSDTLSWSAPSSGPPADGYVIYSEGIPVDVVAPGDALAWTLDADPLPLPVEVVAYNGAGEGGSSPEVVMSDASVVPDDNLNKMWNTYGNQGGHWTGGDATISTPLPDGRDAWLFSDTFLGTVNDDGSRPSDTPLVVHNSMVVQNGAPGGAVLATLTGGTASDPTSLVGAGAQTGGIYGYQANSEFVVGNTLYAFYMAYATGPDGPLSNVPKYVVLAQFSLPDLTLQSATQLPVDATKLWGMAVVQSGGYVYIYGNGNSGLYVARAPASGPASGWQFWTGSAWSGNESNAVSILNGVGGLSVAQVNGQYVLVTFDQEVAFDNHIVTYTATAPTGPFGNKQQLYTVPPRPNCGACFAYYPQLHQEFAPSGYLTISYNINSLDPQDDYADEMKYRPVFIDAVWPRPQPPANDLPMAPSNLTATSTGSGIQLSWTASPTADVSYHVWSEDLSKNEKFYSQIGDAPSTSYLVTNLTQGDNYQFVATAYNTNGDSPPSNSVTATFNLSPPSTAPANLTATAQPDGSVDLSWDPVAGAQWYTLLKEDVTAGEQAFTPFGPNPAGTSYTAQGLDVGDTYEFEVKANNVGGAGPPSAPATATVYVTPPSAPTGLTATANDDGTISVSWSAPSSGCPCWYMVYYQDATKGDAYTHYLDTTTTATLTYLNIRDTYNIKVTATNRGGEGPAAGPVSAVAYMPPPGAPTNLGGVASSDGTIGLSWSPPTGCPGCWYWVHYRDATQHQSFTSYLATGTTAKLTYLNIHDTYEIYITATNAGGEGPPTPTIQVTATMALPDAPRNLQAAANQDGTIGLSWDPPDNCPDCWYMVHYRDATKNQSFTSYLDTSTSAQLTYLNIGDNYDIYLTATNAGGEGPATPTVTVKAYQPPSAPQNLTATPGDGHIGLSWTAPSSGCPCWYMVHYRDATKNQSFTSYLDTGTTANLTYLTNGDSYEIYITATNAGGEGPPSNTVRATPKMPPPSAPSGVTATAKNNGTISLSWTAPGSGCPCWYLVYYRDATKGDAYTHYLDTTTSATLTYLNIGDTYQAYVVATNAGGYSPASSTVSAKAYMQPPGAPTGLSVSSRTDGMTVDMSWNAPGSGCPCWYFVHYQDATAHGSWQSYLDKTTSAKLTFLTTGHTYNVYVTATNAGGEGPGTPVATVVPQIPAPHLSVCMAGLNPWAVLLCWTAANPKGAFWIYLNGKRLPYPVIGQDALYVSYLPPGTDTMYVTAAGNGGESPPSNSVTLVVPEYPTPSPPPTATISHRGCTFPSITGFTCIGVDGVSYADGGGLLVIGDIIETFPHQDWCGALYFTISSGPDSGYHQIKGYACAVYGWPASARGYFGYSVPAGAQVCAGGDTDPSYRTYPYTDPSGPACATAKPYS
jgi:hypothetical protein